MLLSREAIAEVVEILDADHFYKPAHGHLYDAVMSLYGAGEPVDAITVADELERAALLDRTASCTDAGITWTIHSDEMVTPMEPLRCIDNAVNRDLWREPGTVLAPSERVPVEQAIRAMTADAAWQCHSDHEIGTLEPGKFADFVVLDADPRSVEPADIRNIGVLETWMDGRRVYPAPD